MKIKVEIELPIEIQDNDLIIKGNETLNKVLGATSASSNSHVFGVEKLADQTWKLPIKQLKNRIAVFEERISDNQQKLDFAKKVLESTKQDEFENFDDDFDTFDDGDIITSTGTVIFDEADKFFETNNKETNVAQSLIDKHIGGKIAVGIKGTIPQDNKLKPTGAPTGKRLKAWTIEEHNIIVNALTGSKHSSHNQLANVIAGMLPDRSLMAIEQRLSKTERGVVKEPKYRGFQTKPTLGRPPKVKTYNKDGTPRKIRTVKAQSSMAKWSIDEHKLVENNLSKLNEYTVESLANALQKHLPGRSIKAIELRIYKQQHGKVKMPTVVRKSVHVPKTKTRKPNMKGRKWTAAEEKVIVDNHTLSPSQLKRILPGLRTNASINTKLWQLRTEGKIPSTEHTGKGVRGRKSSSSSSLELRSQIDLRPTPVSKETMERLTSGRKNNYPTQFTMIPNNATKYVYQTVKECIFQKEKIEFKDISWIESNKQWDYYQWNNFVSEFIMAAQEIANYYGIPNKFKAEKIGAHKFITYK